MMLKGMDSIYLYLVIVLFVIAASYTLASFINNPEAPFGEFAKLFGVKPDTVLKETESGGSIFNLPLDIEDIPASCDFYGSVVLYGEPWEPAPLGALVEARVEDGRVCGSFVVSEPPGVGYYGFLHCECDGDYPSCDGETISFTVNGVSATP